MHKRITFIIDRNRFFFIPSKNWKELLDQEPQQPINKNKRKKNDEIQNGDNAGVEIKEDLQKFMISSSYF